MIFVDFRLIGTSTPVVSVLTPMGDFRLGGRQPPNRLKPEKINGLSSFNRWRQCGHFPLRLSSLFQYGNN